MTYEAKYPQLPTLEQCFFKFAINAQGEVYITKDANTAAILDSIKNEKLRETVKGLIAQTIVDFCKPDCFVLPKILFTHEITEEVLDTATQEVFECNSRLSTNLRGTGPKTFATILRLNLDITMPRLIDQGWNKERICKVYNNDR